MIALGNSLKTKTDLNIVVKAALKKGIKSDMPRGNTQSSKKLKRGKVRTQRRFPRILKNIEKRSMKDNLLHCLLPASQSGKTWGVQLNGKFIQDYYGNFDWESKKQAMEILRWTVHYQFWRLYPHGALPSVESIDRLIKNLMDEEVIHITKWSK